MQSKKTIIPKLISRQWYQLDAARDSMGRIATAAANILRGKHRRDFTPHMDMGDFVVVINADKPVLTGRKIDQKKYYRHSGYLGGIKHETLKVLIQKNPKEALKRAVFNMIDDVKFRKKIASRLKLITGTEHSFKINKIL